MKKHFTNQHPEFKNRKDYNRRLQQYIIHYEGEDINSMDDVSQFFKELLIDIDTTTTDLDSTPIPELTTDLFSIYFETFHDVDSMSTVNLLADKVFEHRMTSKDNIVKLVESEPYSFNTFTSSQYDNTEFKKLLIDSGAATCSTEGIGQLEAL